MKINITDGSTIETDSLEMSDIESLIYEKNQEIYQFYKKYGISFKLITYLDGNVGGASYFKNHNCFFKIVEYFLIFFKKSFET